MSKNYTGIGNKGFEVKGTVWVLVRKEKSREMEVAGHWMDYIWAVAHVKSHCWTMHLIVEFILFCLERCYSWSCWFILHRSATHTYALGLAIKIR